MQMQNCCAVIDDSMENTVVSTQETTPAAKETHTPHKGGLRPAWKPGQSGNPNGRPRVEPRVRRFARRYDQRMCKVLASIAEDAKAPISERRKAAMDLIAVGSGRPATTQELVGKNGAPVGPLVNVNIGAQSPGAFSPSQAYKLMVDGVLDPDPQHFVGQVIEGSAIEQAAVEAQP